MSTGENKVSQTCQQQLKPRRAQTLGIMCSYKSVDCYSMGKLT